MNFVKLKSGLCLLALVTLAGCGSPGVPLPPSLELARPVSDLRAVRKGNTVYLTWSAPQATTDRHNIQHPGPTEVCRAVGTIMHDCGVSVGQIPFAKPPAPTKAVPKPQLTYSDRLPANLPADNQTANVVYAVRVLNSYGRSAGFSNLVEVPAAPTLPPPADFQAQLTAEGIRLTWKPVTPPRGIAGLRYVYRVYRREAGVSGETVAGEVAPADETPPSLLDRTFAWEKTYDYRLTVVTVIAQEKGAEQQVEGEDTPSVTIVAHDVFPPTTPVGLQAVFSGPGQKPFIDLIWAPDTESDLAGYNVYRHEQDGQPVKLNSEPVKAPTFRATEILPGHQYSYSVSAVDVRGNESPRSEEASETVPSQ
jgi:predicted small lipoprotein YifL